MVVIAPSNNIRITNNIGKGTQITSKLSSLLDEVKIMDNKLFSSSGKLKHGEEATHKLFEQQIGKITNLQTRVRDINNSLTELKEKCSRLFKVQYSKPTSKKRKQNKIKAKQRKLGQQEWKLTAKELLKPLHLSKSRTMLQSLLAHYLFIMKE